MQATHDDFGAKSTTHDSQLIVKHAKKPQGNVLELIGTVHVDDIKIAYPDDRVFNELMGSLEKV